MTDKQLGKILEHIHLNAIFVLAGVATMLNFRYSALLWIILLIMSIIGLIKEYKEIENKKRGQNEN